MVDGIFLTMITTIPYKTLLVRVPMIPINLSTE